MGETDVEGNHFKMRVDDWDIIGQCTTSLMTVTTVVKQTEGDKYPVTGGSIGAHIIRESGLSLFV